MKCHHTSNIITKHFAIEVSCCVKTQTDKPACLPENARLINLLVRFLRSLYTAQSSSIINVFVPEKKSSQIPSKSFISSTLLASGESTTKRLPPLANPR